jgi:hypothetical protein
METLRVLTDPWSDGTAAIEYCDFRLCFEGVLDLSV